MGSDRGLSTAWRFAPESFPIAPSPFFLLRRMGPPDLDASRGPAPSVGQAATSPSSDRPYSSRDAEWPNNTSREVKPLFFHFPRPTADSYPLIACMYASKHASERQRVDLGIYGLWVVSCVRFGVRRPLHVPRPLVACVRFGVRLCPFWSAAARRRFRPSPRPASSSRSDRSWVAILLIRAKTTQSSPAARCRFHVGEEMQSGVGPPHSKGSRVAPDDP